MKLVKLLLISTLLWSNCYAFGSEGCDNLTTLLIHADSSISDYGCNGTGAKTITNTGTVTTGVPGKFLTALVFDGTTKYLTTPQTTGFNFAGDFAIDCWVRCTDKTADTQFRELWNNGGSSAGASWMGLAINTSGFLDFITADTERIIGTTDISDGALRHVKISRKGSDIKLFVNGIQEGSTYTSAQDFTQTATNFTIGIYSGLTTGRWVGTIDEFRVSIGSARNNNLAFIPPTTPYCAGCEMMEDDN